MLSHIHQEHPLKRSASTASTATKAYAKAKAAQAELAYAVKEADMMKQRAELEANMLRQKAEYDARLHLLQCQRAAAAAEAEATAYEEDEVESGELSQVGCIEEEPFNTAQRTSEYVQHLSELFQPSSEHVATETFGTKMEKLKISDTKPAMHPSIKSNIQPVHKGI